MKPKIKPYITVFPISDEEWGFRGGAEEILRIRPKGADAARAMRVMLPYLDGEHETADILAELGRQGISAAASIALLKHLEQNAVLEDDLKDPLTDEDDPRVKRQLSFFSRFSMDGGRALQRRLLEARVGLIGDGGLGPVALRQLKASGIGEIVVFPVRPDAAWHEPNLTGGPESPPGRVTMHAIDRPRIWPDGLDVPLPNLLVVALSAHDPALLDDVERLSFEKNVPWCLLQISSAREASVGPFFLPRESACYSCMEGRVLSNLRFPKEYLAFRQHLQEQEQASAEIGCLSGFYDFIAGIATIEIVKFLTACSVPQLVGRFITFDTTTWASEVHDVLRLPQCRCRLDQPTFFPWKEVHYVKRQGPRS